MVRRALATSADRVPQSPTRPRLSWLPPLVIVLAILASYWTVCLGEFTNWDDQLNVTQNPHLNPPTIGGELYFWEHPYAHLYIPLSYSVWWVLAIVGHLDAPDARGIWLNPYLFHSANLLLHIGTSLIVYRLLRLLSGGPWAACAGALLFALHPLQVEAVAWVTGLKDVLCGLLSVAALWQFVEFARLDRGGSSEDSARARRRLHYVVAAVLLVAALLAKTSAVSLPLLALVIDRLLLCRPWRRVLVSILPWCLVCGVFIVIGMASQPANEVARSPLWARPLIAGDALAWYMEKLLVPVHLAALYPRSVDQVLHSGAIWWAWLLPVSLAMIVWALYRQVRWPAAAFLVFVLAPLPVLGLVPSFYQRFSIVADRYAYVAMLGPSLALAFALRAARTFRWQMLWPASASLCAGGLAVLAILDTRQARYWHDTKTLFSRVLQLDPPNDVAYDNLASDALASGQPAEAEQLARRAFDLKPNAASYGITLADALLTLGRESDAGDILSKVLQQNPTNVDALTTLAGIRASTGHPNQAIDLCRRALSIDPSFSPAHRSMAMLLMGNHQDREAVTEAAEAVRLDPMVAINHLVYGKTLALAGRQSEADQQFAQARALDPGSAAGGSSGPSR